MDLYLSTGIGDLTFGMTESEVCELIGKPDKTFVDENEDNELVYQYNSLKLMLTFYLAHQGKLGYIRTANPNLLFRGNKLIGLPVEKVKREVFVGLNDYWEVEDYHFFTSHLNETHWLVLNSEYDCITDIELGIPIDDNGEYKWN